MATANLDEAAIQLAETLPVDAVPAKLRCGSCNKLAIDALKLPCCAQSICQPCSLTLPETCPICSHSPVSAEDCAPIKSLRMSVKAFLKNEQKKRNKDIEVGVPVQPADTPAEQTPAAQHEAVGADTVEAAKSVENAVNGEAEAVDGAPLDIVNGATETQTPQDDYNVDQTVSQEVEGELEDEEDDDDHVIITTERPEEEMEEQQQHPGDDAHDQPNEKQEMQQVYGNGNESGNGGFGFDQNQQNFGGMDFSNMNNFNPMMMQNGMGMPNFAMGMQNMMGMPGMNGMNMNPSMMFNGGFGGMGGMNDMSMMNMGMGMGNMGGFGGMPGMGMGGGPGFFPGNGGYNQQSFGNNMHQNFHHNRGYGGRPYGRGFRGRGWGGYNRGRGNWQNHGQFQGNQNYMNQPNYQQQQNFQGGDDRSSFDQQQGGRRGSPSYEPMNGAEAVTDNPNKESTQSNPDEAGVSNNADINVTDQAGTDGLEGKPTDPEGDLAKASIEEGVEGKHDFVERSPAQRTAQALDMTEDYAEDSVEDAANDMSIDEASHEPAATSVSAEGGAEHDVYAKGGQQDTAAIQSAIQPYDQQYQQGFGPGVKGRGGFGGGRGGFRGRGGAYGYVATPGVPEQPPAPPINAPLGPKAYLEGRPNTWRSALPPPAAAPAVSPTAVVSRDQLPAPDERGRTRSRSRSRSDRGHTQERDRSPIEYEEHDEARHEKRRRRDDQYESERNGDVNGGTSSRKGRSRSETPDDDKSRRRHRDKDEDRHNSRSRRERSKDRHRRRHRSRSQGRDISDRDDDAEDSRRKSKSDRRRESRYDDAEYSKDKDRSRKSSRRDDDYPREPTARSNNSSKHARSSRDDRERERDRRPVLEEPQDDIGFKIKGSKSASIQAGLDSAAMGPPTTFRGDRDSRRQSAQGSAAGTPNTSSGDPYAEERERRQRERLDRENSLRRQSTQSLGKRTSRDEDEFEAPAGPKADSGRAGKKVRRKVSYKYEDEVGDGYEERDRRWR